MKEYYSELKEAAQKDCKFILIGTKADYYRERITTYKQNKRTVKELGMKYIEVS